MFKIENGEAVLAIVIPKETLGNLGRKRLKAWCHSKAYTEFWDKTTTKAGRVQRNKWVRKLPRANP